MIVAFRGRPSPPADRRTASRALRHHREASALEQDGRAEAALELEELADRGDRDPPLLDPDGKPVADDLALDESRPRARPGIWAGTNREGRLHIPLLVKVAHLLVKPLATFPFRIAVRRSSSRQAEMKPSLTAKQTRGDQPLPQGYET